MVVVEAVLRFKSGALGYREILVLVDGAATFCCLEGVAFLSEVDELNDEDGVASGDDVFAGIFC